MPLFKMRTTPSPARISANGPDSPNSREPVEENRPPPSRMFTDALCAEVTVNGKPAGVLWRSPYRIDISTLAKPGKNTLEIRITNTWHNWRIANKFTAGSHAWEKLGLSLPRSLRSPRPGDH